MKNIDPYSTCQIGQTHPYPFKQARYDTLFLKATIPFSCPFCRSTPSTVLCIKYQYITIQYSALQNCFVVCTV